MDEEKLKLLLSRVQNGECNVEEAVGHFKHWPAEDMEFACLDHHRSLRTGMPEVVFGENKDAEQIVAIMQRLSQQQSVALATRVDSQKATAIKEIMPQWQYYPQAQMLTANEDQVVTDKGRGVILILSAGTSDIPVAEEAMVTARCLGNEVKNIYDVGVAGIHRLFAARELLDAATVLVVVAGMEGALPSVVAGMVANPVIAVPTSVGYGTGFGGIAALLGMLNSCAPGIAVVNIDNGFGAGCMASAINRS